MRTPHPVLNATRGSGSVSDWLRDRPHWLVVALAALAAIAAVLLLTAGPTRTASQPAEVRAEDQRYATPGRAPEGPPLIDHSVVESKSLLDEPDMTGASIGTYAP